jgi:hypothetical protein
MNIVEVVDLKRKSRLLVDDESGEVVAELKMSAFLVKGYEAEPPWGKSHWVYMDMIADGFTGKAEFFFRLMSHVKRDGSIMLNKEVRESLMQKCGISARTLENYVYALHRGGQIYREQGVTGVYRLNPFAYTFGPWEVSKRVQNQFRLNKVGGDDLEAGRQDSLGGYSDSSTGSPGDECLLEDPVQTKGG